jgi:DEAD/DEAH box helicase domain-containing protein
LAFSDSNGEGKAPVPDSTDRPSIGDVLAEIQEQGWYKEQIVHRRTFEAREGQIGGHCSVDFIRKSFNINSLVAPLHPPLSCSIVQALVNSRNIQHLYTHQVAAIHAIGQGNNVIVSTSTASGKSVMYQVR